MVHCHNNNASTIMKASEQTMQQHFEQLGKNMYRLCPIYGSVRFEIDKVEMTCNA